jgi:hypothetical protein
LKQCLLGPDRACKVLDRALHCGLAFLRAWPGGRARGLDCGLSPKTRPAWACDALKQCLLGPDRACKVPARALHCGHRFLRAWPGGRARGLDCRLSPKTRPAWARDALKQCLLGPDRACKVLAWALHCGLAFLRAWPGGRARGLDCLHTYIQT